MIRKDKLPFCSLNYDYYYSNFALLIFSSADIEQLTGKNF